MKPGFLLRAVLSFGLSGIVLLVGLPHSAIAQQAANHVLSSAELEKLVPAEYFYRGQKATVQMRNAVGMETAGGMMVLAALVDTSGYSTAIQQKYQGLLITEAKLKIGGSEVGPGQYGFGFSADGKFMLMNVANSDLLSSNYQNDDAMKRAMPLKLVEDGGRYRLYAGKKYIAIQIE